MANQALIDYIMHQRVHGASEANIKNALLHAGWEESDVDGGLNATKNTVVQPDVPANDVVIKPDQGAGTAPIATPKKRIPILAILLLVIAIIIVAVAAVFVYLQFLRPQPVRTVEPTTERAATTTQPAPLTAPQPATNTVTDVSPTTVAPVTDGAPLQDAALPSSTTTMQASTSTQL